MARGPSHVSRVTVCCWRPAAAGRGTHDLHPRHRRPELFQLVAARLADVRPLRPAGDGAPRPALLPGDRRAPRRVRPPAPCPPCASSRTAATTSLWDTLAIAETLAERHPDRRPLAGRSARRGRWPAASPARCTRASSALRDACPMNLRRRLLRLRAGPRRSAPISPASRRSGARRAPPTAARPLALRRLQPRRRLLRPGGGPDRHLRPAGRRRTAAAYVAAHLADPAFLDWRAEALAEPSCQPRYDLDLPERPWPGPAG